MPAVKYNPPVLARMPRDQRDKIIDAMQSVINSQFSFEKYNSGDPRADWAGYWAEEFIRCCAQANKAEDEQS